MTGRVFLCLLLAGCASPPPAPVAIDMTPCQRAAIDSLAVVYPPEIRALIASELAIPPPP